MAQKDEQVLQETIQKKYVKAFIVEGEIGEKLIQVIGELPMKYSGIVGPLMDAFMQSYRVDLTIDIPKPQEPKSRDLNPIPKDEK